MDRLRGFTIIELLVVVVVMSILAALAVPSFQNYIAYQRVKSASFDLYSSLIYARSEASHRRTDVTITPNGSDWANGWNLTTSDGSTTLTLRVQPALRGIASSAGGALVYGKDGRTDAASTGATITLDSDRSGVEGRCVTIEANGAPRTKVKTGATCP